MPPASATLIKPRKRVMTPTRPMASSTAPPAAVIIAAESASMGVRLPHHRHPDPLVPGGKGKGGAHKNKKDDVHRFADPGSEDR
jgi:hypothetical protein